MTQRRPVERKAPPPSRKALVLLSGGVDSALCLLLLRNGGFRVTSLFVDYGQPACRAELLAARRISRRYGSSLQEVRAPGLRLRQGEISGRNLFLLAIGANRAIGKHGVLVMGLHSGVPYADCSPTFVREVQRVFDSQTAGTLTLTCPLLEMSKQQVYALAASMGLSIAALHSCERSNRPCGRCASCKDRSCAAGEK